jgi:hypothetical protein
MQASAASNSTRDEVKRRRVAVCAPRLNEEPQVVRFVCESKLFFMSRPQTMTKASDSGVREQVLVWFERTQRRIFYRDLGWEEKGTETFSHPCRLRCGGRAREEH